MKMLDHEAKLYGLRPGWLLPPRLNVINFVFLIDVYIYIIGVSNNNLLVLLLQLGCF